MTQILESVELYRCGPEVADYGRLETPDLNSQILAVAQQCVGDKIDSGVYFQDENAGCMIVLKMTEEQAAIAYCGVDNAFRPTLLSVTSTHLRPHTITREDNGTFVKERNNESEELAIACMLDVLKELQTSTGPTELPYETYLQICAQACAARFVPYR